MLEHSNSPTNREYALNGLSTYVDGKMKRYSLLFTVNGGAFAIAKLLGEPAGQKVVGGLTLEALAIGAIIFTVLMWFDIFAFGQMMRSDFLGKELVFKRQGKLILTLLSSLLIIGWLLAAFWETAPILVVLVPLPILGAQSWYWWYRWKKEQEEDREQTTLTPSTT